MEDAEDVAEDLPFPEQAEGPHRPRVGGGAVRPPSMRVVQLGRTVEAEADREALGREEVREGRVDEEAVGLQAVARPPPGREMGPLEPRYATEILEAEEGGLAAVPLEMDGEAPGAKIRCVARYSFRGDRRASARALGAPSPARAGPGSLPR